MLSRCHCSIQQQQQQHKTTTTTLLLYSSPKWKTHHPHSIDDCNNNQPENHFCCMLGLNWKATIVLQQLWTTPDNNCGQLQQQPTTHQWPLLPSKMTSCFNTIRSLQCSSGCPKACIDVVVLLLVIIIV
jgi:hypothetical protein